MKSERSCDGKTESSAPHREQARLPPRLSARDLRAPRPFFFWLCPRKIDGTLRAVVVRCMMMHVCLYANIYVHVHIRHILVAGQPR